MDPAGWWWLGWLVLGFLPKELWGAIATPTRKDTFSEWVWWAFGVRGDVKWARARRTCLAAFLLSLTAHLVLGWSVIPVELFGLGVGAVIVRAVGWERKNA